MFFAITISASVFASSEFMSISILLLLPPFPLMQNEMVEIKVQNHFDEIER